MKLVRELELMVQYVVVRATGGSVHISVKAGGRSEEKAENEEAVAKVVAAGWGKGCGYVSTGGWILKICRDGVPAEPSFGEHLRVAVYTWHR